MRSTAVKQAIDGGFLEQGEAQDLYDFVEARHEREALLYDGNQDVDRDGDPDLRFDGVFGTKKCLDAQVLLDSLERVGDILPINITPPK
jgi:hypothetical protein